ncbi:bcl-2-related protein A1-like [Carcharodon carcharias]|uniref:bcl-2-related protein A1-like n=1 Tax=Carcharodon carcharias TaxID=13397 RepID=UPI001B7EBA98|nr:bcl-2-related protein A1-like [Carcharodon carcharias]
MGHEGPDSKGFVYFLIKDYLTFALEGSQSAPATNSVAKTLRKAATFLQGIKKQEFELCINKLNVGSIEAAKRALPVLLREVYSDGTDNWGRLVALYVFCGVLVRHLRRNDIPEEELVEEIAECVAQYTWTHKAAWIKENGGWEKGFVEYFQHDNPGFVKYFQQKSPLLSYAKLAAITGIVAAFSFVIYQH